MMTLSDSTLEQLKGAWAECTAQDDKKNKLIEVSPAEHVNICCVFL